MRTELIVRKRLLVLMSVLILLFLAIGVRIGGLTLVEGQALTARGVAQWTREGVVTAQRGAILDKNGETLVLSANAYIVCANPQQVADAAAFARAVAPVLSLDEDKIVSKLSNKRLASVILKRQVDRETVDALRSMRAQNAGMNALLKPLSFDEDTKR